MSRSAAVMAASMMVLLSCEWISMQMVRGYLDSDEDFHPERPPVARPDDYPELGELEDVSFASRDNTMLFGWRLRSRNGAAVVLTHGTGADRTQLLTEGAMLARHGFGVLLFDWPGHGQSGGRVEWGESERAALSGAIDWLVAGEGPATRIGALGFSSGGYITVQVAAADPRIRAVMLEGTYGDARELARAQGGWRWPVSAMPALLAMYQNGMNIDEQRPLDVIASISPRPVLLLGGTEDRTVPDRLARSLYEAALPPKDLWIVPGAHHGHYAVVAPRAYEERLVGFFDRWLPAHP